MTAPGVVRDRQSHVIGTGRAVRVPDQTTLLKAAISQLPVPIGHVSVGVSRLRAIEVAGQAGTGDRGDRDRVSRLERRRLCVPQEHSSASPVHVIIDKLWGARDGTPLETGSVQMPLGRICEIEVIPGAEHALNTLRSQTVGLALRGEPGRSHDPGLRGEGTPPQRRIAVHRVVEAMSLGVEEHPRHASGIGAEPLISPLGLRVTVEVLDHPLTDVPPIHRVSSEGAVGPRGVERIVDEYGPTSVLPLVRPVLVPRVRLSATYSGVAVQEAESQAVLGPTGITQGEHVVRECTDALRR